MNMDQEHNSIKNQANNKKNQEKVFHLIIKGRVQNVGFRYFTIDRALKYNIKGTVANNNDKNVEIYCQGKEKDLDMFIEEIRKGPALSNILDFKINEDNSTNFFDFRII